MATVTEQLIQPEGSPDDFQVELEREEKRIHRQRPLYPHTTTILVDLQKTVTYVGPYTTMTRATHTKTCRDAAIGKFDSANWSVRDITSAVGERAGTLASVSRDGAGEASQIGPSCTQVQSLPAEL